LQGATFVGGDLYNRQLKIQENMKRTGDGPVVDRGETEVAGEKIEREDLAFGGYEHGKSQGDRA